MDEQIQQPEGQAAHSDHGDSSSAPRAKRRNTRRKGRSLQRQRALDVLFEADVRRLRGPRAQALLEERQQISTAQQPIQAYGVQIVQTYLAHSHDVDAFIDAASPEWSLGRMSVVDRNILRIGTTELVYLQVERPIAVKEAASLAREFSSEKSVGFTMGVLNRVADIHDLETSGSGFDGLAGVSLSDGSLSASDDGLSLPDDAAVTDGKTDSSEDDLQQGYPPAEEDTEEETEAEKAL
ncbi:MAG: transcription antitermination factor NusB [Actinomycetaceae bacterium]|nr:transcription antitermination factor NusB [Actinomycetaceae bacterium]MDY5855078.1 transcription antitermination factor NusB [Arcanobacterium sp.]